MPFALCVSVCPLEARARHDSRIFPACLPETRVAHGPSGEDGIEQTFSRSLYRVDEPDHPSSTRLCMAVCQLECLLVLSVPSNLTPGTTRALMHATIGVHLKNSEAPHVSSILQPKLLFEKKESATR